MSSVSRHAWPAIVLAALAAVALLRSSGQLSFIEHAAEDARARLLQHDVESDIVIVGIDAISLAELDSWPWPRGHHAALIERLRAADPRRVFVDVDFSSPSNDLDDARLEAALAAWRGAPVILPVFLQQASGADTDAVLREPLHRFARHVQLAAVNQLLDTDGLVRQFRPVWRHETHQLRSVASLLSPSARGEADASIDYSIALSSFSYVSYADLLAGRIDPDALRGKTVFIGATAIELGDILAAPVHGALPGVVVQALALETARRGAGAALPDWLQLAVPALLAVLVAAVCRAGHWRRSVAALLVCLAFVGCAFVVLHAALGISVELAPSALVVLLIFLVGTVRSLDEQTLRALGLALGLRRRDALLRSIVESSADAILCIDARGMIQIANPAAARLFDVDAPRLIGTSFGELVPELRGQPLAALPASAVETEGLTRTGSAFPIEVTASRVLLVDEELYTVIARDITERLAQKRELEYRATHDSLTTLPNRSALVAHMEQVLRGCTKDSPAALLMLDLARFKEVNDTLGHDVGDQVLKEAARRFRSLIGERGLLARIGGDEFTAMLPVCDSAEAARVAQALADTLRTPIEAEGVAIDVGVTIGIARAPHDASDSWTLLQRADVAMYVAKRRLAATEFYDESRDAHSVRRLAMVAKLRAAIGTPGLHLYYQPKVNLRTRRVESVEALLRWEDPALGEIKPAEFVPLAESTDLVRPLTEWTIAEALRQTTRWHREGAPLRVAVNLSARLLQDAGFPARLGALLADSEELPGTLELEITESAMMVDLPRALRTIREIAELGVPITIDDFGTGFSSLAYLRDLPVQALKLDKSFVIDIEQRPDNRVIAASTIAMAHALTIEVVAEGVETEWAAAYLARTGCDYVQGYLYTPALAPQECLNWIRSFNMAGTPLSCDAATDVAGDGARAGAARS